MEKLVGNKKAYRALAMCQSARNFDREKESDAYVSSKSGIKYMVFPQRFLKSVKLPIHLPPELKVETMG